MYIYICVLLWKFNYLEQTTYNNGQTTHTVASSFSVCLSSQSIKNFGAEDYPKVSF